MSVNEMKPLPVSGYTTQSAENIALVNEFKADEERILRKLDEMLLRQDSFDVRWTAIARTHIQEGFMAMNRAVLKPTRIKLPEDTDGSGD